MKPRQVALEPSACYAPRLQLRIVASMVGMLALVPAVARGEGLRIERSKAAEGCPDTEAFDARLREGTRAPTESSGTTVVVRFDKTRSGYSAAVTSSDGTTRSLSDDGSTCGPIADATVLAVRLALDLEPARRDEPREIGPNAATDKAADAARDRGASSEDRAAASSADALAAQPTPPRRSPGIFLLGGGGFTAGVIDSVAPVGRATAGITLDSGRWILGATGALSPTRTKQVGSGEVDLTYVGGGAEACRRHREPRFAFAVCARGELGALTGAAHGFDRSQSRTRLLGTASLLARGQLRIFGPSALFAELGVVAPLIRERFSIDGVGIVHDPVALAPAGTLGMILEIE